MGIQLVEKLGGQRRRRVYITVLIVYLTNLNIGGRLVCHCHTLLEAHVEFLYSSSAVEQVKQGYGKKSWLACTLTMEPTMLKRLAMSNETDNFAKGDKALPDRSILELSLSDEQNIPASRSSLCAHLPCIVLVVRLCTHSTEPLLERMAAGPSRDPYCRAMNTLVGKKMRRECYLPHPRRHRGSI